MGTIFQRIHQVMLPPLGFESLQLFHAILAEGGEIDAASHASAHLPFDLSIPTRMISRIERELAEREKPDA